MKYLLAVLILALASSRAWASAPVNDNFASAAVITVSPSSLSAGALANGGTYIITSVGSTDFTAVGADTNLVGGVFVATGPATGTGTVNSVGSFAGSNVSSSSEIDEPVHGAVGAGNSVWWKWTATATGTVTIDTNGSSFDTVLAVYKGTTVGALTAVAYDDDISATNLTSKVSFTAVQNAVYYIAVDGFKGGARGATGAIALHLAIGPGTYNAQNDDYANRAVIAGEYSVETGSSELASLETGENSVINNFFFFYGTVNSVWWTWTAPRAGKVTVTSSMLLNGGYGWANFYGELGLYSANGDTISSLSFLSGDEGGSGTTGTPSVPSVVLTVTAGEVLQIRVADYVSTGGGQITLTVSMDTTDFTNDHFAKRTLLSGSSATASVSTNLATAQTGEPGHYEEVTADSFITGDTYMINSLGTTDFTAVGATSNSLGLEFTATGAGTGTGTALHLRPLEVQSGVLYTADQIEAGKTYIIQSLGSTDWEAIGDFSFFFFPAVGDVFTATAVGTGTGTVSLFDSGLLTVGKTYRIESIGSTDFRDLGAATNTLGITFTATNTGYGSGTVLPVDVITAGSFVIGRNYRIESVGTTDFTAIGAAANTVGTIFQATGAGSGTGTASTPTASKSAWWSWVAPSNGYVSISTAGSTFGTSNTPLDTLLKIYTTGNLSNPTLADIVPLASNDDSATDVTSFVHFQVVKGTSYQIAVDSGDLVRDTGTVNLGLVFTPDVPIITTQVQDETAYVGLTAGVFTVSNTGAVAVYDWQVKLAGTTTWVHYGDGVTTLPDLANGIATSTLTVPLAGGTVTQVMNGDQYRCIISNTAGQVTSQAGTLTAVYLTTYQGGSPTKTELGLSYTVPLLATEVTYYASGLPAGLKIDPLAGTISGRITAKANTTYTIKYWTTYVLPSETKKSKSDVQDITILVNPFPAAVTGSFEGLLVDSLGVPVGKVSLLVNTSGAFTGTLMYGGSGYALRGALVLDDVALPTQGAVTLKPDKAQPLLSLTITVKTDSTMTATLTKNLTLVGDVGSDGVQLKTYDKVTPAPWAGTYTLALNNPFYVSPDAGPEGSGYGLVTIDFQGVLHLRGKLADGTICTALLPTDDSIDGQYRPYIRVYSNKYGYLSGWMPLSKRGTNSGLYHIATIAPVPPIPTTGGSDVYWVKNPIPNDKGSYPSGFGPAALNVIMEPWIAPTNSYLIGSLGLLTSDSQTIGNFGLTMTQTSGVLVGEALPTSLKMDALSRVAVLTPSVNSTGFAFKITTKTGYFKGGFTLSDTRKVTFEGALLQLPTPASGNTFGYGYFLVPPPLAPTVGTTTSGDIQFTIP